MEKKIEEATLQYLKQLGSSIQELCKTEITNSNYSQKRCVIEDLHKNAMQVIAKLNSETKI